MGVEPTRVPGSPEGVKRGKKSEISGQFEAQSALVPFSQLNDIVWIKVKIV